MSLATYKYSIDMSEMEFDLYLPIGAEVLDVQLQRGEPQMWALVDPNAPKERRHFIIAATGQHIPEAIEEKVDYLATWQQGIYVWHIFEVVE